MFAQPPQRVTQPTRPARVSLLRKSHETSLWWLNLVAGCVHGLMAVLTLALANFELRVPVWYNDVATQIVYNVSNYSASGVDTYTDAQSWTFKPGAARIVGYHNLPLATFAFFLVTAIGHLGPVVSLRWRHFYFHTSLDRGQWVGRWVEYAITAPIMFTILIAYFLGTIEVCAIIGTWALMAGTMACGFLMEVVNPPYSLDAWRGPDDTVWQAWTPQVLGWALYVTAWAIALIPGVAILGEDNVPEFVPWLVFAELLLYSPFGIVQLVTYVLPPRYFVASEHVYIILSLTSKVLLGGLVLANVLVLGSFAEIWTTTAR